MRTIVFALVLTVCFTQSACFTDETAGEGFKIGVNEEITLDLFQALSQGVSSFELLVTSDDLYDCNNAGYNYNLYSNANAIELHLQSIALPQPCAGGPSQAREKIAMPSKTGTYELTLVIGDLIQNTGTLVITPDQYQLTMDEQHGISILHDRMYKIPTGMIWGSVFHPDQLYVANQKLHDFFEPMTDQAQLANGYYGFFSSLGSTINQLSPAPRVGSKTFAFQYSGSPEMLTQKMAELRALLPVGTDVKLYDWTGAIH